MADVEKALKELEEIEDRLTDKQKEFLKNRKKARSDSEAARMSRVSPPSVSRWKGRDHIFRKAYDALMVVINRDDELIISQEEHRKLVQKQLMQLQSYLPRVISRLVDLALNAASEQVQLNAIKTIFDKLGIDMEQAMPIAKQHKALVEILQSLAPQFRSEAEDKGIPMEMLGATMVNAGRYRVVEEDK